MAENNYKESLLYQSGDLFLSKDIKKVLYTYLIGNNNSLMYLNGWSVVHFLSGVAVFLLLNYFSVQYIFIAGLIIHTIWEFWQIFIGMTKLNVRGLIDICMDTALFMFGAFIAFSYFKLDISTTSATATAAIAVFQGPSVKGEAVASPKGDGCKLEVSITEMPPGKHGFHIHNAGDLRGEGCKGACSHFHKGAPASHGGPPSENGTERHTGDLGNIQLGRNNKPFKQTYILDNVKTDELWGRSLIIHADEDDLGAGGHSDSATTGHSGARIACAIFGRGSGSGSGSSGSCSK